MWVYLNGQILEEDQAFISPLDRGFTFGDGVYEVIPSYNGRLFLFDDHLKRLKTSLEKTFIPLTDDIKNLHKILFKLQQKNQFSNQSFYVQVTRGVDRVRVHAADEKMEPTFFITSQELQDNPFRINPSKEGLTVRLEEDIRWHRCDIKTIALLGNTLALNDPTKSMVDEIIFHKDGIIKKYKTRSSLRKPGIGMFLKASKIWNIDRKKSFMIGDQVSDEIAAKKSKIYFEYARSNFFKQIKDINKNLI